MRKIEKIGLSFAVIIGIGVGGFFTLPWILGLFTKDIPPIDDHDLRLQKVLLLDSENAYFDLIRGGKALSLTKEEEQFLTDATTGKTWDDAKATTILEKNATALAFFTAAAEKAAFQDVAIANPADISFEIKSPNINDWRTLTRLSALRTRVFVRAGNGTEGLEEILHSIRISSAILRSQSTLIEYLVALGMKEIGINTARDIVSKETVDSTKLKQIVSELSNYYDNEKGLESAFRGEYMGTAQIIDRMATGDFESSRAVFDSLGESSDPERVNEPSKKVMNSFYFRQNKSKKIHAEMMRAFLLNTTKPCGMQQFPKPEQSNNSSVALYFSDNAIGKLLTALAVASYENVFTKKCQDDLLVGVLQATLALKMHITAMGAYPATLSELVPQYFPSVPLDPFDGKPLRYSPTKKILYSVGKDLIDEGGSTGDDWKKMNDPTFPVAF
ncbi:hypothetical protein HY623_00100 [Candidatus Uhrbacteria bacterium]|nr:hypothetical protein [Candidatus Uhrbacteria bacterium]